MTIGLLGCVFTVTNITRTAQVRRSTGLIKGQESQSLSNASKVSVITIHLSLYGEEEEYSPFCKIN